MIAAFLQKQATSLIVAAALLLAAALLAWRVVATVDGMVSDARAQAVRERDAYWTAEIEKSNAFAARQVAEQAKSALAIETDANARVRAAEAARSELETKNEALPDGDAGGISRERVRLLNNR